MTRRPADEGPQVLALDIGGTHIRAAAVAGDGSLVTRARTRTPRGEGRDALLAACLEMLEAAAAPLPADARSSLLGIGISSVGPLDVVRGTLIEPPNVDPAFHGVELAAPIGAAFGLPASLERDTHVAALAERQFGAARGIDDFLYVTVSTGLGGAIVTRGRLLGGPDGVAGELGHLVVEIDGPVCGCGHRGHLEALSSGSGIARVARLAIEEGRAPGLAALAVDDGSELTAEQVAAAEDAGDAEAAAIMSRARRALAVAMVGLVNVFAPERIVVGGGIARGQGERLLGPAREEVARYSFRVPARRVEIVPAALGDDVSLVGALPLVVGAAAGQ